MSTAVVSQIKERQRSRLNNYNAFARHVANGATFTPEAVDDFLAGAEKSPGDLEADIRRHQERKRLADTVAAAVNLSAERANIQSERARIVREFEEAQNAFHAALRPLQVREEEISVREVEAKHAQRRLRETANDDLKARSAAIHRRMEELAAQHKAEIKLAERNRVIAAENRSHSGKLEGGHPFIKEYDQRAADADARAIRHNEAARGILEQLDQCQQDAAAVSAEMLTA